MKKIVITTLFSIAIGFAAGWYVFRPGSLSSTSERRILYYRDPMNPQNTSPAPKKAPDGMDFVPVYDESAANAGGKKIAYYKDPMHPWFTSERPGKSPDCGMDMVPVYEGENDAKGIKIDPVTVQNIGVKVEDVVKRKLNKTIRAVGKVDYDERNVYSVNTKIMGWVEKLYVDYTGKRVHKGEPLMELYSPELVSSQEEYLQALRFRKELQESTFEEARKGSDELIQSARRRLQYWDIPESEIKALEERGTPQKTMTIYSPVEGIVMDKMVQKGQNIMAGMELYKIADLSTVWILAEVYQYELPWVKVGGQVEIEISYLPGKSFKGTITYVYPYLSMETRTAKVRIEVPNTQNIELKPDMFATVKIISPVTVDAVVVPDQAIIRSGERNIAVIALGGGYFDPREVKLGLMSEGYVQILEGVKEGEKIVVSSQFLIDSESNLKAAISQMSGHAGMDMSKPMPQSRADTNRAHVMPMAGETKKQAGHKTIQAEEKKKSRRQNSKHGNMEMKDMKMDMNDTSDSTGARSGDVEGKNIVIKAIDPVCGMEADPSGKYSFKYKDKDYYFCSEEDMDKFKNDPETYTGHNH